MLLSLPHAILELVPLIIVLLYSPAMKFPITCKGAFGPVVQIPTYHHVIMFTKALPFKPI